MRLSKKQLTPNERAIIAQKTQDKAIKKLNRLDKKFENDPLKDFNPDYKNKRSELNRVIARAIADEKAAREIEKAEAKNPKPVPKFVDNSKVFAPQFSSQTEVNIGSKNEAKAEGHIHLKKEVNKTTATNPTEMKKKSKAKWIFFGIVAVLVLAGVIALTVHIHSCILDSKNSSSDTYSAQTI